MSEDIAEYLNKSVVKRGRGRPKKEGGKTHFHSLRLNESDEEKLIYICETEGLSVVDALRDCLLMRYNLAKFQHKNPKEKDDS